MVVYSTQSFFSKKTNVRVEYRGAETTTKDTKPALNKRNRNHCFKMAASAAPTTRNEASRAASLAYVSQPTGDRLVEAARVLEKNWVADVPVDAFHEFEIKFNSTAIFPKAVKGLVMCNLWMRGKVKRVYGKTTIKKNADGITTLKWRCNTSLGSGAKSGFLTIGGFAVQGKPQDYKESFSIPFRVAQDRPEDRTLELKDYITKVDVYRSGLCTPKETVTVRFAPEVRVRDVPRSQFVKATYYTRDGGRGGYPDSFPIRGDVSLYAEHHAYPYILWEGTHIIKTPNDSITLHLDGELFYLADGRLFQKHGCDIEFTIDERVVPAQLRYLGCRIHYD